MVKKILILAFSILILSITALSALPDDRGFGQKLCLARNLLLDKTFAITHPYPIDFKGNSNKGYAGPSSGTGRVPVLTYHFVVPEQYNHDPDNLSIINLESFEKHMAYLYEQGYYTAGLSELEDFVHDKIQLPEKTVVITFDDGYENNYVYAYPILKKYGFQAAIFLIGSKVKEEASAPFDPGQITYLSKSQIVDSAPVFEFHSHTYDLHYYIPGNCGTVTSAVTDIDSLQQDIHNMKEMGMDSPYFAYPYGIYNDRAVYTLMNNGYRMAFTTEEGLVSRGDHPMFLPRYNMTSETDLVAILELSKD